MPCPEVISINESMIDASIGLYHEQARGSTELLRVRSWRRVGRRGVEEAVTRVLLVIHFFKDLVSGGIQDSRRWATRLLPVDAAKGSSFTCTWTWTACCPPCRLASGQSVLNRLGSCSLVVWLEGTDYCQQYRQETWHGQNNFATREERKKKREDRGVTSRALNLARKMKVGGTREYCIFSFNFMLYFRSFQAFSLVTVPLNITSIRSLVE